MDYLKAYGSIIIAISTVLVSLIAQWAVFGFRLSAIEARQDRQGDTISMIRTELNDQGEAIAAMKEKLDSINDNVNYIRSRIDAAVK